MKLYTFNNIDYLHNNLTLNELIKQYDAKCVDCVDYDDMINKIAMQCNCENDDISLYENDDIIENDDNALYYENTKYIVHHYNHANNDNKTNAMMFIAIE